MSIREVCKKISIFYENDNISISIGIKEKTEYDPSLPPIGYVYPADDHSTEKWIELIQKGGTSVHDAHKEKIFRWVKQSTKSNDLKEIQKIRQHFADACTMLDEISSHLKQNLKIKEKLKKMTFQSHMDKVQKGKKGFKSSRVKGEYSLRSRARSRGDLVTAN